MKHVLAPKTEHMRGRRRRDKHKHKHDDYYVLIYLVLNGKPTMHERMPHNLPKLESKLTAMPPGLRYPTSHDPQYTVFKAIVSASDSAAQEYKRMCDPSLWEGSIHCITLFAVLDHMHFKMIDMINAINQLYLTPGNAPDNTCVFLKVVEAYENYHAWAVIFDELSKKMQTKIDASTMLTYHHVMHAAENAKLAFKEQKAKIARKEKIISVTSMLKFITQSYKDAREVWLSTVPRYIIDFEARKVMCEYVVSLCDNVFKICVPI